MRFVGPAFPNADIQLDAPGQLDQVSVDEDVRDEVRRWYEAAEQPDVLYFWIFEHGRPVGHTFLYEMNATWSDAHVGLHIFQSTDRRRNIGSQAVALLSGRAARIAVSRLHFVAQSDDAARRRIAERCAFVAASEAPSSTVKFSRALEWQPTIPADANVMQRAVDAVNLQLGTRFALGEALGGQHRGAWAVEASDGMRGVLKASDDGYRDVAEPAIRVVSELRRHGYPAPRPIAHGPISGGGHWYLQERAPGQPMRRPGHYAEINSRQLDGLLEVIALQAGLAPEGPQSWSDYVEPWRFTSCTNGRSPPEVHCLPCAGFSRLAGPAWPGSAAERSRDRTL